MSPPLIDTAALYRQHAGEVSRWVRSLAGPDGEIEDVVQEVFIIAHRNRSAFRGEATVKTWLFGIANNVVRRQRRVQKVRRFLGGTAKDVAGDQRATDALAPDQLARRQAQARVYRVLEKLSDKFRNAIILFELEGRSAAEIAELHGVTPQVVWVWLSRARTQFYAHLEALERAEGVV